MRPLWLIKPALVVASGSIVLAAAAHAPPQQARSAGLIVGQIVDAGSGRPIGGAIVTLSGTTRAVHSPQSGSAGGSIAQPRILTGADGLFVFRDLPPGSYGISSSKPGYADGAHGRRRPGGPAQPVALEEGERIGTVVVPMWKQAAISGIVLDEAGEPVVGATVRAWRRSFGSESRRFGNSWSAMTDDRGVYRLANLLPGEYLVGTASRQVAVPESVPFATAIRGSDTGSYDAGMAVPGSSMRNAFRIGDTIYAVGDGAVPPPPAGEHFFVYPPTFHPAASNASEAVSVTIASGEDRDGVDLQLRPVRSVRVSGTVTQPDGPAGSLTVRLFAADVDHVDVGSETPIALTDWNGAFTFPAVPSGQYSLRAAIAPSGTAPAWAPSQRTYWAHVPLTIGESDMTGVAVVLQNGLRSSGTVAFEGITDRPTGARLQVPISLEPADGTRALPSPGLASSRVDGSGEFTTAGVPAGRYFLRVTGSPVGWMFKAAMYNGIDVSETPFELTADVSGIVLTFTDRWTGMRGAVRTASGQPDSSATVLIFPTDPRQWTGYGSSPRRMRSVRTTKTGEFSVTSLPAGDYYVMALPDENTADWQDTAVLEGLSRLAARVTLNEGDQKTLDVRVREAR
jgi:Carboxypeptidase regulatory-like domain